VAAGAFLIGKGRHDLAHGREGMGTVNLGAACVAAGAGLFLIVNHLLGWRGLFEGFPSGTDLQVTPREMRELPGALVTLGLLGAGALGLYLIAGGEFLPGISRGFTRFAMMAAAGAALLLARKHLRAP